MAHILSWSKGIAIASLAVLAPARPLFLAAMALVALDTLTGVMAARKRGVRISSAGFRRTLAKATAYTLAILCAFVAGNWLLGSGIWVAKLVSGAIGVTEATSCLENCSTIAGQDLFRAVISKLTSKNDAKDAS